MPFRSGITKYIIDTNLVWQISIAAMCSRQLL